MLIAFKSDLASSLFIYTHFFITSLAEMLEKKTLNLGYGEGFLSVMFAIKWGRRDGSWKPHVLANLHIYTYKYLYETFTTDILNHVIHI